MYIKTLDDVDIIEMPAWGHVLDAGTGSSDANSDAALESEWQVAINQAAELAKAQGKLPGNIETIIGDTKTTSRLARSSWPFFVKYKP